MQFRSIVLRSRRWKRAAWRRRRPICAAISAALYLVLVLGIPLPMPSQLAAKDTSQPFPCMDSPCGCRNAEQCWRHCCCHTLVERLTWAREHNVRPPEYVLAEAKAEGIDWESVGKGSCSAESGGKCCCYCRHDSLPSPQPAPNGRGSNQAPPHQSSRPSGAMVLVQLLGCCELQLDLPPGAISLALSTTGRLVVLLDRDGNKKAAAPRTHLRRGRPSRRRESRVSKAAACGNAHRASELR